MSTTTPTPAPADRIESLERELADLRKATELGTHRLPGFSLNENPVRVQRLGFAWLDDKKRHRLVEFSHYDCHPLMTANNLRAMADAIEERYRYPENFPLPAAPERKTI